MLAQVGVNKFSASMVVVGVVIVVVYPHQDFWVAKKGVQKNHNVLQEDLNSWLK